MVMKAYGTGSRGVANQASDHALSGTNDGRFSKEEYVKEKPSQQAHCCAHVGVKHGQRCIYAGCVWISTVESMVSHQKYVVWREPLSVLHCPWSYLHTKSYPSLHSPSVIINKLICHKITKVT